jgi:hypothetical protein
MAEKNPTAAPISAAAPPKGPSTPPRLRRTVARAAPPPETEAAVSTQPKRIRRRAPRPPRPAPPPSYLWGVGLAGAGALLMLVGLLATHDVEAMTNPWDPWRIAVYALLVLGPAALFWAVAQGLRMGRFWLFGTAAWAVFGYVLIFVPPPVAGLTGAPWITGFLGLLFVALLAGLTLPLYALGWMIFTHRVHRQDLRRAVRQAGLLALFVVACLGMALFSVFNGLNALLLFVVLALAEFFFLSRG